MSKKFNSLIEASQDEFHTPVVRAWSLEKYKLVGSYCDIFTSGMKYKWNQLVYIDLFAGAGLAQIEETGKIYYNSALIALSIPNPFTKYILCEEDDERFAALEGRIKKHFSHLNVHLIKGDSNKNITKILASLPAFGKGNTLLPFCFVDPYSLNLNFSTIETLCKNRVMDFLILQALHMDANRNFEKYFKDENPVIADYLGIPNWREANRNNIPNLKKNFVKFLFDQYKAQMVKLQYKDSINAHHIRSNDKNLPLYYLTFFSKHTKGIDFFRTVEERLNSQTTLDL